MKHKSLCTTTEMINFIIEQIGKNLVYYPLKSHKHSVTNLVFSFDGNQFISGSFFHKDEDFNNIFVWNSRTRKLISKLVIHDEDMSSVVFSNDGKEILSTTRSDENNVALWNAQTGVLVFNLSDQNYFPLLGRFSRDGKKIILVDAYCKGLRITAWNAQTGKSLSSLDLPCDNSSYMTPGFSVSPDDTKIAFFSRDEACCKISLADMDTGQVLFELESEKPGITLLAFSPDGIKIASGHHDGFNNIIIWDVNTGKKLFILEGHESKISSLCFSGDGMRILSTTQENRNNLMIWDALTGEKLFNLVGHCNYITSASIISGDRYILSSSLDDENNLIIWDALQGKKLFVLTGHTFMPYLIKLSPDDKTIVAGGSGKEEKLMIWDVPFEVFTIIKNDLNTKQLEFLYDHYSFFTQDREASINSSHQDYEIYLTLPEAVKQIMYEKPDNDFLSYLKACFIEISNFFKINSLFVQSLRFKRQCKRLKIDIIKFARQMRKSRPITFIWKQKKDYGFLSLTLSKDRDYSYNDASSVEMCILFYFIACDGRYGLSPWKEWGLDDNLSYTSSNLTALEKEKNSIIITDLYSEEEVPTELEMTNEQFIQLLTDWEEKVVKLKPKEVIIKYENDQFIFETKD